MSKAIAQIAGFGWDTSTGFGFSVSYAVSVSTPSSPQLISVNAGNGTAVSQRSTVDDLIRTAVVSDALSRYSLTILPDDVIVF